MAFMLVKEEKIYYKMVYYTFATKWYICILVKPIVRNRVTELDSYTAKN